MKLYAFWRYDIFPFVLGGEISGFCETDYPGKDYVEMARAKGVFHKPIKIVPLKLGLEMQKQLNKLEADYNTERKNLFSEYKNLLKEQFPDLIDS